MNDVHVIGHTGMVGSELVRRGCIPLECDIRSPAEIVAALSASNPSTIVLCAAKTNVEWCEAHPLLANNVNARGVSNLVDKFKGKLIYISTDHVFSGHKFFNTGYSEKHSPSPVNVYGQTKLAGELMAKFGRSDTRIIRTSKLFDKDYVGNKLYGIRTQGPYEFSNVLKRSFLHVQHFVDGLLFVLDNWEKIPIILNISGTDIMSHFAFFRAIVDMDRLAIPEELVKPRNTKLLDVVSRPIRGGLNVGLARSLGVSLYSAWDGIELL